jgi:hypothetical protein
MISHSYIDRDHKVEVLYRHQVALVNLAAQEFPNFTHGTCYTSVAYSYFSSSVCWLRAKL